MTGRSRIGKSYVTRNKKGQFVKWSNTGKSIAKDRKVKSPTIPKKRGMGNTGDYKKK